MAPEDLKPCRDDSDLQHRWEEVQKRVDAGNPDIIEQEAIDLAFKDIVRRRRLGELTDTTRIMPLIPIIRSAMFPSTKISIDVSERTTQGNFEFSWKWRVAIFGAKTERLQSIADEVSREIAKSPAAGRVYSQEAGLVMADGEGDLKFYHDGMPNFEEEPESDRNYRAWIVDTRICRFSRDRRG